MVQFLKLQIYQYVSMQGVFCTGFGSSLSWPTGAGIGVGVEGGGVRDGRFTRGLPGRHLLYSALAPAGV